MAGPPWQLHPGEGAGPGVWLAILELCLDKILFMLVIHLYETLTVFLLMILWSMWDGGKQMSMILRNFAPMLVDTFAE